MGIRHEMIRSSIWQRATLAIALLVVGGSVLIASSAWLNARHRPVSYDEDGRPRLTWHRWNAPRPRTPIVVVAVDTLRADVVGPYGAAPSQTPRLDTFAAGAAIFDNAITAAIWTLPSFTSMFTGLYPPAHGVMDGTNKLADAHVTLAEILRGAGYDTAGFTAGGYLAKRYGLDHGFATYHYRSSTRTLQESVDDAIEWLGSRDGDEAPYFLFVHGFDPHRPYRPRALPQPPAGYRPPELDAAERITTALDAGKRFDDFELGELRLAEVTVDLKREPEFDDRFWEWVDGRFTTRESMHFAWRDTTRFQADVEWLRRLYAAKVPEADDAFGNLLDALDERGDLERALIVFISDHGEELMDHTMIGHTRATRAVCRVPFLIKPPAGSDIGPQRVKKVVRSIDLLPTLLDWIGLPAPPVQGRSLLPQLRGHELPSMPAATFGTRHPENAVRYRGYRLIDRSITRDDPIPGLRLYDVRADPTELQSLADSDPATTERMHTLLREIENESRSLAFALERASEDGGDDEALRELGYLGGE